MSEWQSIVTAAQQEGHEILALHQPSGERWIVHWRQFPVGSSAIGAWVIKKPPGRDPILYFNATHWMPLPEPPK